MNSLKTRLPTSGIEGVLLDFDGTVLNSFPAHFKAYQAMFRRFNMIISRAEFLRHYSPNWLRTYEAFRLPREHWAEADRYWLEENGRLHSRFFPGVKRVIEQLKKSYKVGLVTSGSRDRVMNDLGYNNATLVFDAIVTGDDVQERKPHPEGLLKALNILGVESGRVVYVGDAVEDLQMAQGADIRFIAVQSEFAQDLPRPIESLRDLPSALREL